MTGEAPADRVTAVEVFFDVVFVLTLTQLTRTLEADLSLAGVARLLLVFGALWYMYGGYAWLTNHVPPRRTSQKLVLFAKQRAARRDPLPANTEGDLVVFVREGGVLAVGDLVGGRQWHRGPFVFRNRCARPTLACIIKECAKAASIRGWRGFTRVLSVRRDKAGASAYGCGRFATARCAGFTANPRTTRDDGHNRAV